MRSLLRSRTAAMSLVWLTAVYQAGFVRAQAPAAPPPAPAEEQPEALTSGPVHEAFAQPVNVVPEAGLVAPSEPPADIEETPPAERPVGDQYSWVPGYWAWDGDRRAYVWVSGCWRMAPPNTSWVPGYWARASGGWQWVGGFWAPAGQEELEYLPAPPAIAEAELLAPGAPPSPDRVWVPPCWYWRDGHYVRRNGYWLQGRAGWIWTPSRNVWTPRGYVFCAGHWDYDLANRGVLFAPVYFQGAYYARPGFVYSPSIVLDVGALTAELFVYPAYCHYYFGDYYDDAYIRLGIYPRFDADRLHRCYDPIYVHDRWQHRDDERRWEDRERHEYDRRRADRDLRPPRTYREMETRLAKAPARQELRLAQPLSKVAADNTAPVKLERSRDDVRQKAAVQAADSRKFRQQRTRWEQPSAPPRSAQPTEREGPSREGTPAAREGAPAAREGAPAAREGAPAAREGAPAAREGAAAARDGTPAAREGAPATPRGDAREPAAPEAKPGRAREGGETAAPAASPGRAAPISPDRREPAGAESAAPDSRTPPDRAGRAERVKIPAPPTVSRRGEDTNTPARPDDERQDRPDAPRDEGRRGGR